MNGQYQKIPATRWRIPKHCKQHIIVLLGQMIEHRLPNTLKREEPPTKKGREHPAANEVRVGSIEERCACRGSRETFPAG